MSGIGIISNPFAKINKRDPKHNTLMWYILGNRGQFEVTNTLLDLSRVCREFQQRGVDLVGIVGGDGTISLTLSAIYEAYGPAHLPRVVLLRGGTINVVASNLGIFGKPKDVMDDFMAAYHSGKPLAEMTLHTLRVNNRLGFLFANGMASNFLTEFYKNKTNSWGAGVYLGKVLADALAGGKLTGHFDTISRPESMSIATSPVPLDPRNTARNHAENKAHERPYSMVLASTVPKMPFGIHLYRDLKTEQSQAQLIAIAAQGKDLVGQAMRILAGRSFSSPNVSNLLFKQASMQVEPGTKYSLDGDVLETSDGKIEIEMGPGFVFCSPYGKVL